MRKFQDATGREWSIDVNVGSVERVKSICGINLVNLFDDKMSLLSTLSTDLSLLANVLWELCGQMEPNGKPAFLAAMRGDALENAANALFDDVIDFFPNRQRRETLRAAVAKVWEVVDASQELTQAKLGLLDAKSLASATNLAESSGSTPAVLQPVS